MIEIYETGLQEFLYFGDVIPYQPIRQLTLACDAFHNPVFVTPDVERPSSGGSPGNSSVDDESQWLDFADFCHVNDGIAVHVQERDIHAGELQRYTVDNGAQVSRAAFNAVRQLVVDAVQADAIFGVTADGFGFEAVVNAEIRFGE